MRKIFVIISLSVIFMFLVSCVPQMTDEELEAELAKLTPEEREELLADLEAKESEALAGQAVAGKYGISPKVTKASKTKIEAILSKQLQEALAKVCKDSDGFNLFVKGTTTGRFGNASTQEQFQNLPIQTREDKCVEFWEGDPSKGEYDYQQKDVVGTCIPGELEEGKVEDNGVLVNFFASQPAFSIITHWSL